MNGRNVGTVVGTRLKPDGRSTVLDDQCSKSEKKPKVKVEQKKNSEEKLVDSETLIAKGQNRGPRRLNRFSFLIHNEMSKMLPLLTHLLSGKNKGILVTLHVIKRLIIGSN